MKISNFWLRFVAVTLLTAPTTTFAAKLELGADTNIAWHIGAGVILYTHIIGGGLGLLAGLIASLSKKGVLIHRRAGTIFLASMIACYGIGAIVAPFLEEGQRVNFVAAILALYLLFSGIQAVKLKTYKASQFNRFGLGLSLGIAALGLIFMYMGGRSENGTLDGSPPEAFLLFVIAGTLSSIGEARILIIGKLSAQGRIYRHLWRMCFSFFIASASLFSGQIQLFPGWFAQSSLPVLCSLFPLFVLIYWTGKILLQTLRQNLRKQSAETQTEF